MGHTISDDYRPHVVRALVAAHIRRNRIRLFAIRLLYRPTVDEESVAIRIFFQKR